MFRSGKRAHCAQARRWRPALPADRPDGFRARRTESSLGDLTADLHGTVAIHPTADIQLQRNICR
jgi:hypothetical protein